MILRRIEQFLAHTGMAWTRFGRIVAHDPRLVQDMRNGRQPRPTTVARIEAFFAAYDEQQAAPAQQEKAPAH